MNLGEAKKGIAMLIDRYSERGALISTDDGNVKDFYYKMPFYLDIAQKHIASTKYIRRFFKVSNIMPSLPNNFALKEHIDTDIVYTASKAFAYSFKVDNIAEVDIEGVNQDDTITVLDSVYAYSDGGFVNFKDLIFVPDNSNFKRIQMRFRGEGYYNIKDVALFPVKYNLQSDIPEYGRYIEYAMPSDFDIALKAEIRKNNEWENLTDFSWENPTTLAVSIFEKGEIRIEYAAKPQEITANTADTYEFEIIPTAQNAMILYATALLIQKEDYSQHQLLMQQYIEQMANIKESNSHIKQTKVKRTYRW